jgi:hypothetical protein
MAKAHLFVSNSIYEDFSATVVEQMYTGLVPVLLRAPWSEYLVPDGYPYLFRSMAEGQAMVRYVVDHLEEITAEWVPQIQHKIRRDFDLHSIVPQMVDWIGLLHADRMATMRAASRSLVEVIRQAHGVLPDEFDLPQFYAALSQVADNLDVTKQGTESRATSPWLCADVLRREFPDLTDLGDLHARYRKAPHLTPEMVR